MGKFKGFLGTHLWISSNPRGVIGSFPLCTAFRIPYETTKVSSAQGGSNLCSAYRTSLCVALQMSLRDTQLLRLHRLPLWLLLEECVHLPPALLVLKRKSPFGNGEMRWMCLKLGPRKMKMLASLWCPLKIVQTRWPQEPAYCNLSLSKIKKE